MPISYDNYSIKFLYFINVFSSIYIIGFSQKLDKYFRIDIIFDEFVNHNATDEYYFQIITNGRYFIIKTEFLSFIPDYVENWEKINFTDSNFPYLQYNIPCTIFFIICGLLNRNHIII